MSSGGPSGPLPYFDKVEGLLHTGHQEGGIHLSPRPFIIAMIVMIVVFFILSPAQSIRNFAFLIFFAPLWLPFILFHFTYYQWITANKTASIARHKTILLELRMPRDTMKTPAAMESVFSAIHLGPGEATWWKRIVLGQTRPWYSLEIVSLGGRVHFYIWTRDAMRRAIESALYAQYPGMEIIEVEDYSLLTDPSHEPNQVVGFEYIKNKPDAYPIRTYVEFGLDRTQKPEEQTDPLAQITELLGSLGPNEQLWIQLVIRTHKGEKYNQKNEKGKTYTWKDTAKEVIRLIREDALQETEYINPGDGKAIKTKMVNPTKGQLDTIAALDRNVGKLAYDVGIRALYTAPKEYYQGIVGGYIVSLLKPFSSEGWAGFDVAPEWSNKYAEYPWEDPGGHHQAHSMHLMIEMYRRRAFFHAPYIGNYTVMSTEELATIFHVPSSTIATPGLARIQSTTGGAPSNLPT